VQDPEFKPQYCWEGRKKGREEGREGGRKFFLKKKKEIFSHEPKICIDQVAWALLVICINTISAETVR
jgi:hypothetical protein